MDRRCGFTLVETLIVVAIIVMLAAMVFPAYEAAIKRAEQAVCLCNLRSLATASGVYAQDYDGWSVPARASYPLNSFGTTWDVLLQPYLRSSLILICPSDPGPSTTTSSVSLKHSYGINYELAKNGGYNGASLQIEQFENPDTTIYFFDLRGSLRTMGGTPRWTGTKFLEPRHHTRANFAFAAGNAKAIRPDDTLQPVGLSEARNYWVP